MFTNEGKKIIATALIAAQLFFVSGEAALAQTTTDVVDTSIVDPTPTPTETPTPDPVIIATTTDATTDLQGASSTPQLQETFSDQQPASPSDVASTTDITLATSTDATTTDSLPPEGDPSASSTPDTTPPPDVAPTPDPTPEPEVTPPNPEPQPVVNNDPAPIVLSTEELKPDPEYTFSINSGKKISASRRVRKTEIVKGKAVETVVSEVVNTVPNVTVNNVDGVMTISGACEDKYYVILVYKHEDDYSQDKRSYVVNRAFPCEGQSTFSYDLKDLPPTLPDGIYYLLVARMGENTPWEPSTALTEITLKRNP